MICMRSSLAQSTQKLLCRTQNHYLFFREKLISCGSSHHLRRYEPPQMITSSARDGKEMSTTVIVLPSLDSFSLCPLQAAAASQ
jgi:hypothetical protein